MREGISKYRVFFVVTTVLLFLSFAFDVFGAMPTEDFVQNYKDSELLAVNQIRCKGSIGADQLLVARDGAHLTPPFTSCPANQLMPYSSQFGLQGKLYTFGFDITSALHIIRNPMIFVAFAQLVTALISALIFALLVLWVRLNLSRASAIVFGVVVALSPMLVGFSRNLYWALPFMILPLLFSLYYYQPKMIGKRAWLFWSGLGVLIYFRYLCGYEYITTFAILPMAVITYFLYLTKAKRHDYIRQFAISGVVAVVAFGAALCTHVAALDFSTHSTADSLKIIKARALERTVSPGNYIQQPYMNLQTLEPDYYRITNTYLHYDKHLQGKSVVWAGIVAFMTYMLLPVVHLPLAVVPSLTGYMQSMVVFVVLLVTLYAYRKKWMPSAQTRQITALFMATAMGLVGYASWLVFGFSHSIVHAHINGILMYLPFVLFGAMIIGAYVESLLGKYRKKPKK